MKLTRPKNSPKNNHRAGSVNEPVITSRREFLRKSAYAAYATPLIAALLVEKASAAISRNTCKDLGGIIRPQGDCCDVDRDKNTPVGDPHGCEIY